MKTEEDDGFDSGNWELAECVVINIENAIKRGAGPMAQVALLQAKALAKRLERIEIGL